MKQDLIPFGFAPEAGLCVPMLELVNLVPIIILLNQSNTPDIAPYDKYAAGRLNTGQARRKWRIIAQGFSAHQSRIFDSNRV
jgi:hypothetical protein